MNAEQMTVSISILLLLSTMALVLVWVGNDIVDQLKRIADKMEGGK